MKPWCWNFVNRPTVNTKLFTSFNFSLTDRSFCLNYFYLNASFLHVYCYFWQFSGRIKTTLLLKQWLHCRQICFEMVCWHVWEMLYWMRKDTVWKMTHQMRHTVPLQVWINTEMNTVVRKESLPSFSSSISGHNKKVTFARVQSDSNLISRVQEQTTESIVSLFVKQIK